MCVIPVCSLTPSTSSITALASSEGAFAFVDFLFATNYQNAQRGGAGDCHISVFFYSATIAMSLMYGLDSALLRF
jgi:hypothetical protein